jgi:zinc transport system substrate-binding protein
LPHSNYIKQSTFLSIINMLSKIFLLYNGKIRLFIAALTIRHNFSFNVTGMRKAALALFATAVLASIGLSVAGCQMQEEQSDRIGVVVTILPQAEFVESIGGDRVEVTVMVPPGASPHTYEPTPSQMRTVSRARMYAKVGTGVEFELAWMDKLAAANKDMLVVDCSAGVQVREMTQEEIAAEAEGGQGGMMDPHIWMSPLNAQVMVRNICQGLIEVDPQNAGYYEQNRDAYLQKLEQLDKEIRAKLSGLGSRTVMVYHPSLGYFAREYDLNMLLIEKEGKEPTPASLQHLIEQAREHNIKIIFAEPQFNPQSAEVIAKAINGQVVFVDPLARDYIDNLRTIAEQIAQAMD